MSVRSCIRLISPGLAMLIASITVGALQGSTIVPGPGEFPPDIFACSCTLDASVTGSWTSDTSKMSGTYEAAVYSDLSNPFGSGDLDFVFQLSNNAGSEDSVGRVTAIDFTGFLTDVGYLPSGSSLGNGFVNGTIVPAFVDRLPPGDSIGFSFDAPVIGPGQTSTVIVIETNARNFTPGDVNFIDGGVTTNAAFEPEATPEPPSMLLIGGGLLLLTRFVGFRKAR